MEDIDKLINERSNTTDCEEVCFCVDQIEYLQHYILNKMFNKAMVHLLNNVKRGDDPIPLPRDDAKSIVEIVDYIRELITNLKKKD